MDTRYRLQRKETVHRMNVIGNHTYPTPSYMWKDVAASDNFEALKKLFEDSRFSVANYRIIDTYTGDEVRGRADTCRD